jgi:hypothetical protein
VCRVPPFRGTRHPAHPARGRPPRRPARHTARHSRLMDHPRRGAPRTARAAPPGRRGPRPGRTAPGAQRKRSTAPCRVRPAPASIAASAPCRPAGVGPARDAARPADADPCHGSGNQARQPRGKRHMCLFRSQFRRAPLGFSVTSRRSVALVPGHGARPVPGFGPPPAPRPYGCGTADERQHVGHRPSHPSIAGAHSRHRFRPACVACAAPLRASRMRSTMMLHPVAGISAPSFACARDVSRLMAPAAAARSAQQRQPLASSAHVRRLPAGVGSFRHQGRHNRQVYAGGAMAP